MKFFTRREFSRLTLTAIAGASALPGSGIGAWAKLASNLKPNSKVRGVQLGLNVPYSFSEPSMRGEEVLKDCVQLGFSGVELRTQPVEVFLGGPKEIIFAKARSAAQTEELANWRRSVSVRKAR